MNEHIISNIYSQKIWYRNYAQKQYSLETRTLYYQTLRDFYIDYKFLDFLRHVRTKIILKFCKIVYIAIFYINIQFLDVFKIWTLKQSFHKIMYV